jgi:DNA-binding CsgD family transcriptional regulator
VGSPSRQRVLVGRDREVALLAGLVAEVAAGRGRSVWIEGEPGIGKSSLLAAGLADARSLGCEVFWESADEARQRFPLWVLLDCLRVGSRSTDPARAEIASLVRGEGSIGLTPQDSAAAVAERLLVLVDRLCAVSPVVLVVDDLHWADEASLAVWGRLHRAVHQLPLLLVGAARPVPTRPELTALRNGLTGPDIVVVTLGPLTAGEAADVVERLVAATPGPRLRRLAGQAGGNPLYLRELVDALLREEEVRVGAGIAELVGQEVTRPVSLAAAIARRLRFLSEPGTAVLRLAALLGPEFPIEHLRIATGQTDADLGGVVKEAVTAGVLAETGSGDRLAFRHGLIRQALYGEIPRPVRAGLHRHVAQVLAGAGMPVERVAEHLLAVPNVVDTWVADWVTQVAPSLIYRAPQIAVDLIGRVREATAAGDPRQESLDTNLVTARFLLGNDDEAERLARAVLAGASDPAVAGRMTWIIGYILLRAIRSEEALAVTGEALPGLTGVWTARVRALQAMILTQLGSDRTAEAEATARQAMGEGERADDRFAVGYALHALALLRSRHHGDPAAMLTLIDQALAVLGEQPETTDLRLLFLGNRISALDNLGRMAEGDRAIGTALSLAERVGTAQRLAMTRLTATEHYFLGGRWDDSLAELDAVAELPQSGPLWPLLQHGAAALIAAHRDERAVFDSHLRDVAHLDVTSTGLLPFALFLHAAKAVAAERDGQPGQALAFLLTVLDPGVLHSEDSYLWLPEVVRLALTVRDATLAQAMTDACASQYERMRTVARQAAAEHCQSLTTADPALLDAAADRYHQAGLPLFGAQALENAAVHWARRGDAGAAHAAHAAAIEVYTQLGAAWDILRADTRLRPLGIRRGTRGPRRRAANGWVGLTPTELRVAQLVAEGRSNPDIAAELLLSRRTVQSHVSHILAKLGGRSRLDIAREAVRHSTSHA